MSFAEQDALSRADQLAVVRRCVAPVSTMAIAALLSSGAWAQSPAAPSPTPQAQPAESGLGEIIVTAQKREQRRQDVPGAVTAVANETLQVNRVQNVTDLTGLVPGLTAKANAGGLGSPQLGMRGITASSSIASQDREISQYLDGVYIGGSKAAVFNVPDTERIEVLRGPQGTLFGRNATAGAVSIITRDPTGRFGFRQALTVGNEAQIMSTTSIDLPQMGAFTGYVTYQHDEQRGWTRNLGAGTTFCRSSPFKYGNPGCESSPRWLGGHNTENVFAAIKFAPTNDFKMTYKFDNSDGTSVPEVRSVAVLNTDSLIGGLLAQILAAQPAGGGAYGPVTLNPSDRRPAAYNNAFQETAYLRSQGHNLTSEWRATDSLTVKNITAYRWARAYADDYRRTRRTRIHSGCAGSVFDLRRNQHSRGRVLPAHPRAAVGDHWSVRRWPGA